MQTILFPAVFARPPRRRTWFLPERTVEERPRGYYGDVASLWEITKIPKQTSRKNNASSRRIEEVVDTSSYPASL